MSITRQKPGSSGLAHTGEDDGLLGEAAHYGGEKSPSAGQGLAPLRELIDDRLLDALLERSRDAAGGLRLTGEGSMLGELVRAVLERALESELTAHLGYEKGGRGGAGGNARNGGDRQDRADRSGAGAAAGAPGPGGVVRTGPGPETGRAGGRRPGRHGHQPLRARHVEPGHQPPPAAGPVSYTHLRAHDTRHDLVCCLLLEK